jgi:hypothetical protein
MINVPIVSLFRFVPKIQLAKVLQRMNSKKNSNKLDNYPGKIQQASRAEMPIQSDIHHNSVVKNI